MCDHVLPVGPLWVAGVTVALEWPFDQVALHFWWPFVNVISGCRARSAPPVWRWRRRNLSRWSRLCKLSVQDSWWQSNNILQLPKIGRHRQLFVCPVKGVIQPIIWDGLILIWWVCWIESGSSSIRERGAAGLKAGLRQKNSDGALGGEVNLLFGKI